MAHACQDHVENTKEAPIGYIGADGSTFITRMDRYGTSNAWLGSNIFWGPRTGFDIVLTFFLDDGNSARSHRRNLFSPNYSVTGGFSGPHAMY